MDKSLNPFRPGAGLTPPELTGRDKEIEDFELLARRTSNRQIDRGIMLYGLRGVGKTVLLRNLQGRADRMGWITLNLEGSSANSTTAHTRSVLGANLTKATRVLLPQAKEPLVKKALSSVSSLSLSLGFANASLVLKTSPQEAELATGVLEIDFPQAMLDLATALRAQPLPAAVGIFVDEIQDLDDELLETLLLTQHEAGQKDLPFYIIGAGLPSVPTRLGEIKTYAERLFRYYEIDALSPDAAERAFALPFNKPGGGLTEEALQISLETSQGYPYFIQQYGQAIWDAASHPMISSDDAVAGIKIGQAELDNGFYRTRWDRATEAEREFLIAMASCSKQDKSIRTGAIAETLGKDSNRLSKIRESLIAKGLVYSPAYGKLAFTVPGMDSYILRQES